MCFNNLFLKLILMGGLSVLSACQRADLNRYRVISFHTNGEAFVLSERVDDTKNKIVIYDKNLNKNKEIASNENSIDFGYWGKEYFYYVSFSLSQKISSLVRCESPVIDNCKTLLRRHGLVQYPFELDDNNIGYLFSEYSEKNHAKIGWRDSSFYSHNIKDQNVSLLTTQLFTSTGPVVYFNSTIYFSAFISEETINFESSQPDYAHRVDISDKIVKKMDDDDKNSNTLHLSIPINNKTITYSAILAKSGFEYKSCSVSAVENLSTECTQAGWSTYPVFYGNYIYSMSLDEKNKPLKILKTKIEEINNG